MPLNVRIGGFIQNQVYLGGTVVTIVMRSGMFATGTAVFIISLGSWLAQLYIRDCFLGTAMTSE
jgi:hypothetical protein